MPDIFFAVGPLFGDIHAQTWHSLGVPGFTADTAQWTAIAVDRNGTPYVAFEDFANSRKVTVMKFTGGSWEIVGSAGFSLGQISYPSIAIDASGNPYIGYEDVFYLGKATVMKFDGSSWVTVGVGGFTTGVEAYTSIVIDSAGAPYIAFSDYSSDDSYGGNATVMKYNGSSWVFVGTPGFSAGSAYYTKMAFDNANAPYVVYDDGAYGGYASVMKFDGTIWGYVGAPGFSGVGAATTSIAFDTSGTPYITYADGASGYKATVMKYMGSSWGTVGIPDFSAGEAVYTDVKVDNCGNPEVVYIDYANAQKSTVMKFNGSSWLTAGSAGFSDGVTNYTAMAVDANGSIYVVYQDMAHGGRATVMEYGLSAVAPLGSLALCAGDTVTLVDTTGTGAWSSSSSIVVVGSATGLVTAVGGGTAAVSYTVGCQSATATVTVTPQPDAGVINGPGSVCPLGGAALTDTASGGLWSSGATGIAMVGLTGVVNGVSAGSAVISYTVDNSCGEAVATDTIVVLPAPDAGAITGRDSICYRDTMTLSNAATGGAWSSTNMAIGAVSATGVVTGVGPGRDTVRYIVSNSCGSDTASFVFTVRPAGECPNAVRNTAGVSASLSVFPNPNNGVFTLSVVSGIDAVVNLTITNIMGQKVMEIVTVTNKAYDVSMDMPAGIYSLTAQTGQTLTEAKMEVAGR